MKSTNILIIILFISIPILFLCSCKKSDPTPENVPELITKATMTFTPTSGSAGIPVVVTATDPDNIGAQDIKVDGAIGLTKGISYTLSIQLVNELYKTTEPGYDVSKEIENQSYEHQFFFSWSTGLFSNPTGDGNIDNRNDPLNYGSMLDKNGLPVGLTTNWTTSSTPTTGGNSFRILLKHQPDIKSKTSTSGDGESDLDLTFTISVN